MTTITVGSGHSCNPWYDDRSYLPLQLLITKPDPLDTKTDDEKFGLMRSSVIVGVIMLLKAHLKALYGISEE